MSLYWKKTLSLSPLLPWHCWVHWPFISLGWQVWDEGDGVALLSASMSDSLHPAWVGMKTRPPHGSLPFIRALHWGLGYSRHRNTTCFGHLILLGTTKKVRWLTQGRVCKLWIPWSKAILMLSCGHPLTVPHFFIRKHPAQRVMILFLQPLVRQALMVVTGAWLPIIPSYHMEKIPEAWRRGMLMFEKDVPYWFRQARWIWVLGGNHRNKLLIHLQSSIEAPASELQWTQLC